MAMKKVMIDMANTEKDEFPEIQFQPQKIQVQVQARFRLNK